jgi:hypothetical protein
LSEAQRNVYEWYVGLSESIDEDYSKTESGENNLEVTLEETAYQNRKSF